MSMNCDKLDTGRRFPAMIRSRDRPTRKRCSTSAAARRAVTGAGRMRRAPLLHVYLSIYMYIIYKILLGFEGERKKNKQIMIIF